jgi:hypothetical protein
MKLQNSIISARPSGCEGSSVVPLRIFDAAVRRSNFNGNHLILRNEGEPPLFGVCRGDTREIWTNESNGFLGSSCYQDLIESSEWFLFCHAGSLCLRGLDHLLTDNADILWAEESGDFQTDEAATGYLSDSELFGAQSRGLRKPSRKAANVNVFAIRGKFLLVILHKWKAIMESEPARPTTNRLKSAWNRLLIDSELRVNRFEPGEVAFPAQPGVTYPDWMNAALINVSEWPPEVQSKFLQAHYYGTILGDETGWFSKLLDP